MSEKRNKLIILGASGNIGEQALDVLKHNKRYDLVAFSVGKQTNKVDAIIKEHHEVKAAYFIDSKQLLKYRNRYPKVKFYSGEDGIVKMIDETKADIVLNALVGYVGLKPTLAIINNKMDLALANKESLVVGGELVYKALKHSKSHIYPVDSEHSAIYKCLKSVNKNNVKEIILTASGGAFRKLTRDELKKVTPAMALKHPTWKMGSRVTIDSASMLNKGFEVIEAYYLFHIALKKINIMMHDESCVHSMLRLKNGHYVGEVSEPDMRNPIAYALKGTHMAENVKEVKKLADFNKKYHFAKFDEERYPMVKYAIKALKMGGTMPAVLNAVDEVAVASFLDGKCSFLDIEKIIKLALKEFKPLKPVSIDKLDKVDVKARAWAIKVIKEHKF